MNEVTEMRIGFLVNQAQVSRMAARSLYRMGSDKHKEYTLKAQTLMWAARIMYGPGAKARNARKAKVAV